ncbi:MAG TPA: ubiquinol-cytochrome C chaperone family protein [Geminicoccaceae bacterium]|nr:ubiquinol-cytochrome C chaperone family protein [Geminicoccaceae bacterium]
MARNQQGPPTAPGRSRWRRLLLGPLDPGRRARRAAARRLHLGVVAQARHPHFYREWGVPDTPEGRFEVLGLHAFFVLRRLRALGEEGRALGQELFDTMFADVDRGLRELGVSDLSVGRHVRRHARSFYGRIAALEEALAAGGGGDAAPAAIEAVLRRNVYAGGRPPPAGGGPAAFAAYVLAQERHVARAPAAELLAGRVRFAQPESVAAPGAPAGR